jgi:serine protease Do
MSRNHKKWFHLIILSFIFIITSADMRLNTAKANSVGFADIVAPLLPGVVNISTTREVDTSKDHSMPPGSPFEDLFRQFFDGQGGMGKGRPRKVKSLGSGFIIDNSGYIVTNNHVVVDAQEVIVTFHANKDDDEIELKARVVGRDPRTDLALLKVESDIELVALKWGDSTGTRVGDWVITIGNPFGLGSTVTSGIISNIGRDVTIGPAQYIEGFLQIDAPVNQGNSGGPALNTKGEVIGVVNAIATTTGGNIGIGFAIPSEIAKTTIDQLKNFGRTRRGHLGVGVLRMDKEKARYYGLSKVYGAEVNEVSKDGPAFRANIKPGDIILEFNGQKVKSSRFLPRVVGETIIGEEVPVIVWRDGRRLSLSVCVGDYEEAEEISAVEDVNSLDEVYSDDGDITEIFGMTLHTLNDSARERYHISDDIEGVLIVGVDSDCVASDKGLHRGDVVTFVDSQRVFSVKDLSKFIDNSRSQSKEFMRWRINRKGQKLFIILPTGTDKK